VETVIRLNELNNRFAPLVIISVFSFRILIDLLENPLATGLDIFLAKLKR
jgi:hypothetical protein